MESPHDPVVRLEALSPVDGRYAASAAPLRARFSEAALIRERIRVEAQWFLALSQPQLKLLRAPLPAEAHARLLGLARDPEPQAAAAVKRIEQRINHDVKAVEYYVREALETAGAPGAALELVHFGCTSEDLNNLCYARLLREVRAAVLLPELEALERRLRQLAGAYAQIPMLARTHGQPASPTTFGKEIANVGARLERARRRFESVEVLAKWNGAVGNYNALQLACPQLDWPGIAREFVRSQDLAWNPYSTQIEPHDWIGEYCDACAALNVVLLDLSRDLWGYVALGYLRQSALGAEVGSSTMPHKINPIDFENAEGNFGVANALLRFFAEKLPVSRWQRDLSDSTVLRNLGVALAHALIGWKALQRGLERIQPDAERMAHDLDGAYEVLAEAIQSALRLAGVPGGYELLKGLTRGRPIDAPALRAFVEELPLPQAERARLACLTPAHYVGLAAELARAYARGGPGEPAR